MPDPQHAWQKQPPTWAQWAQQLPPAASLGSSLLKNGAPNAGTSLEVDVQYEYLLLLMFPMAVYIEKVKWIEITYLNVISAQNAIIGNYRKAGKW